jgi:hypothetical protein
MVGLDVPEASVHQSSAGWVPVYVDRRRRLGVMSIGFLLANRGDSVVWRGPKKDGMIRQFLSEVRWGDLDYLVIDTPPGTSDEHISLLTHLHPLFTPTPDRPTTPAAVLVSTPQTTALNDTLKSLSFTRKLGLPVLGMIENMAGYVCPCCGEISDCFGRGGGEDMATREGVPFLGRVPIDTQLVKLLDAVSKGELPGADVASAIAGTSIADKAEGEGTEAASAPSAASAPPSGSIDTTFPLLDKYISTTSSQVWREIASGVVERIDERREKISAALAGQAAL